MHNLLELHLNRTWTNSSWTAAWHLNFTSLLDPTPSRRLKLLLLPLLFMLLLIGTAVLPNPLLDAAADAVDEPGAPDIKAVVVIVKGRSGVLLVGDVTLLPMRAGSDLEPEC